MKIQQRFLFILFLILAAFFVLVSQVNAGNPPPPTIEITHVTIRDDETTMEVRGTLTGTSQLPELAFTFLKPGTETGGEVPVIDVDWWSTSGTSHQWLALLDLSNLSDGFYYIQVRAVFSDGTSVTYVLTGDPGECSGGVCTPGG